MIVDHGFFENQHGMIMRNEIGLQITVGTHTMKKTKV